SLLRRLPSGRLLPARLGEGLLGLGRLLLLGLLGGPFLGALLLALLARGQRSDVGRGRLRGRGRGRRARLGRSGWLGRRGRRRGWLGRRGGGGGAGQG